MEKQDDLEIFRNEWRSEIDSRKQDTTHSSDKNTTVDQSLRANLGHIQSFAEHERDELTEIMMNITSLSLEERQTKSMEIYEKGLQLEAEERLQDCIQYYRVAHKLDAEVDFRYNAKYRYDSEQKRVKVDTVKDDQISSNIIKVSMPAYIFKLPNELLLKIMRLFVPFELNELYHLSLSCKIFAVLFDHPSIWTRACKSIGLDVYNDINNKILFQTKPHIRCDGIYISICRYI
eukprot:NODE_381_length_8377_cov_0.385238.p5 type:complete len:233 gc:universal NODE_381_length_8377_cov_0.385238:2380-3078(+)